MSPINIAKLLDTPPDWGSEADGAEFWNCSPFNQGHMWLGRFSGESPWELHVDTDELLHVLEGEVEVTILTAEGPVSEALPAGSVFVVPKGHWHRQKSERVVLQIGVTPGKTEHSMAEDPRSESQGKDHVPKHQNPVQF